jgi:hypothetical protein
MRTQVEFTSGSSVRVRWIGTPVAVGDVATFDGDPETVWEVTDVYATAGVREINWGWSDNI